jgi:hypothetical protein
MFTILIKRTEKQFYGCSDECTNKTNAFWRYALRTQFLFWIGVVSTVVLCFIGFVNLSFIAIGLYVLGITMVLFPFATPETISSLGVKKSILSVRVSAIFIFLLATVFLLIF